jgi:hypothetical protein
VQCELVETVVELLLLLVAWHLRQTLLVEELELEVQGAVLVTVPSETIVLRSVTVHVVVSVVVDSSPETVVGCVTVHVGVSVMVDADPGTVMAWVTVQLVISVMVEGSPGSGHDEVGAETAPHPLAVSVTGKHLVWPNQA